MTTTVGFKVWEEGKKVAIKMPKLQKPAEAYCPRCLAKVALEQGSKIPRHTVGIFICEGVGAVVDPIKKSRRKR